MSGFTSKPITAERAARLFLAGAIFANLSCVTPFDHTSDQSLESFFGKHESGFNALLTEADVDERLTTIQRKLLLYNGSMTRVDGVDLANVEALGMSKRVWFHYQKELKDLNLYGVMKGKDRVEFRVDPGTLFNGDSYKGFEFCRTTPSNIRHYLDGYAPLGKDRDNPSAWVAYKKITGNWYLYIFINH